MCISQLSFQMEMLVEFDYKNLISTFISQKVIKLGLNKKKMISTFK